MITKMRVLGAGCVGATSWNLWMRYTDHITNEDAFTKHSIVQHRKHWFSGMHEPYLPNMMQRAFIQKYFSEFLPLIPSSKEELNRQCGLKSPVHLRRLSDCPEKDPSKIEPGNIVAVGGPPALISTAFEKGLTYINDGRRAPIANGSAFHLEWDAESEAPTSAQPLHFMSDQVKRLFIPKLLSTAQETGHFPWKSLDWVSWIQNPSKWGAGIRIAIAFQRFTQSGPHPKVIEEVASRSKRNADFYDVLNKALLGKLLQPGEGSVYIARTDAEKEALIGMQNNLTKEGREFPMLSEEQVKKEFQYHPDGKGFGKKKHDRTLYFNFTKQISDLICKNEGRVINGRVTTIYTDDPEQGGILEYQTNLDEKRHFLRFKKLVMSLGPQEILGVDAVPLFDIVVGRGFSCEALLHLPLGSKLPPAVVCGDTNHVTKLAGPIIHQGKHLFFVRMTCGALIAPTSDSADYDATMALGLKTAVSRVLKGKVEIVHGQGCSRQVSKNGQTHWIQVSNTLKAAAKGLTPRGEEEDIGTSLPNKSSGIYIQYGAGGGGLTQAPAQ